MATTLLYGDVPFVSQSAMARDEDLWLSLKDLTAAKGLCRGELCVPIPPDRKAAFLSPDERFNLAEFARYLEQPVVHDDNADVWVFGEAASARRDALRSLDAPDFRLPDLDGTLHSLSDYRGKKVLLLSWASW
jgi:hypothetical protein